MTLKLYDLDSHQTEFEATVISCESIDNKYKTELDRTLFFPEEGGQCADKGRLDGINITYVELSGDKIYHYSDFPFEVGKKVKGKIDFNLRFRNMQNHSGEHIICGIAHKLFGFENVGFHLGEDNVTMDLNGVLTAEEIEKIEVLANEAVYKNMPVSAYYPDENELETLNFRAKGDIKENIRIVTIGDVDCCACCAPHVKTTGEIGIIKILDAIKYKGGMRLSILCGKDAFLNYAKLHSQNTKISALLSAKQDETLLAVEKLNENINSLNLKLSERSKQIAKMTVNSTEYTDSNICLFFEDMDMGSLRLIANDMKKKTSSFAVLLSGNDSEGYKYVIISENNDAGVFTKNANAALSGKGGGRGNMTSGTFQARKDQIKIYFMERDCKKSLD